MAESNGRTALAAVQAAASPLVALSLQELADFSFPQVEWVVDDILPAGALALLVGRPKAGKSLLAADLLASVALGEPFLGRGTRQGPAIYVPAEDSLRLVRDRLWVRLDAERGVPLMVAPVDGSIDQSLRLDQPESFLRLAALIDAQQPRLVVLDPLREMHRLRENEADDMALLLRPLRQLAHETDTSIVLIHHRNKHATDPSTASRGSSAIVGSVDMILTMELSNEDDEDGLTPDQAVSVHVEGRYGPRQKVGARLRAGLRWEPVDARRMDDLSVRERVLRYLQASGEALTAEELASAVDAAKPSVQQELRRLHQSFRVVRRGAGTKQDAYRYEAHTNQHTNNPAPALGNQPIRMQNPASSAEHIHMNRAVETARDWLEAGRLRDLGPVVLGPGQRVSDVERFVRVQLVETEQGGKIGAGARERLARLMGVVAGPMEGEP